MPEKTNNYKRWYAVYTRPRHEKKVYNLLVEQALECYLPLEKTLRQWSDRKKWVTQPMFRSYVFVFIDIRDYLNVLKTDGVVRFVKFEGVAVPIPEKQIQAIRMYEKSGDFITEDISALRKGDIVEVIRGPLKGLYGTLITIGKKRKVRIMIEGVRQDIYLSIRGSYLEKCASSGGG